MAAKGAKNPMWRGGISPYPNHYKLKRNRLVVLNLHKWSAKFAVKKPIKPTIKMKIKQIIPYLICKRFVGVAIH